MNYAVFPTASPAEAGLPRRNWPALLVSALVLAGGVWAAVRLSKKEDTKPRSPDVFTVVHLPQEKVIPIPEKKLPPPEITVTSPEDQPDPEPGAPEGITSNIEGPPDGKWGPIGTGRPGTGRPRILLSPVAVWTRYARSAASRIAEAMRRHPQIKSAVISTTARVWIDSTGRITRAETESTGKPTVDEALLNDVLKGMQLSEPPPAGMTMPVNLKLEASRRDR